MDAKCDKFRKMFPIDRLKKESQPAYGLALNQTKQPLFKPRFADLQYGCLQISAFTTSITEETPAILDNSDSDISASSWAATNRW